MLLIARLRTALITNVPLFSTIRVRISTIRVRIPLAPCLQNVYLAILSSQHHSHDSYCNLASAEVFSRPANFSGFESRIQGIMTSDTDDDDPPETSHTKRMIEAFCKPTHYKKECISSLNSAKVPNKDDPRQLAAEAFNLTRTEMASVLTKFKSLEQIVSNDTRGRHALKICSQLTKLSERDLERAEMSFARFGQGDFDLFSEDLSVWTGGVLSYQDICLESFMNSTTNAGEKMKDLLFKSRELVTNALGIIHEINVEWKVIFEAPKQEGLEHNSKEKGKEAEHEKGHKTKAEHEKGHETETKKEHKAKAEKGHEAESEEGHKSKSEEGHNSKSEEGHKGKSEEGHKGKSEEEHKGKTEKEKEDANVPNKKTRKRRSRMPMAGEVPEWVEDQKRSIMAMPLADIKADVVVAKDGSGKAKTIRQALHLVPKKSRKAVVIHIKEGIYHEHVTIQGRMNSIILVGDGPNKTIISGNKNFADGLPIYMTSTIDIDGDGFMARDIGFENTAGPEKSHAVATRVSSDYAVFYNCHFSGFYNTLYTIRNRQFFRDCTISGTVDFIFGDSIAVFQNCLLLVRTPLEGENCTVTGQARSDVNGPGATIFQNCTITSEPSLDEGHAPAEFKAFLGRPWKPHSRTIVMQTFIDKVIAPEGWASKTFSNNDGLKSVFYGEFKNKGPGSDLSGRVEAHGVKNMTIEQALKFCPGKFFAGDDEWITNTGCPYYGNMLQTTN